MPEPERFYLVVGTHDSEENNLAGTEVGAFDIEEDMSSIQIGNMVRAIVQMRVDDTERE